jgi:uncharacterized metal-binding protein
VKDRICRKQTGSGPKFCSTLLYKEPLETAAVEYAKTDVKEFARQAALQEAECYAHNHSDPDVVTTVKPRVQEVMEFSRKMGYQKLGVAFCGGLHREAAIFCKILEDHGFTVVSVMCKVGGVDKSALGLTDAQKIRGGFESMCNPVAQAEILNAAQTDFNILLGLCVGHDSLFLKYSQAMVTVLAVKDRLLGHNPLACIYTYESYYSRFKHPVE